MLVPVLPVLGVLGLGVLVLEVLVLEVPVLDVGVAELDFLQRFPPRCLLDIVVRCAGDLVPIAL